MYPGMGIFNCSYDVPDILYRGTDDTMYVWEVKSVGQKQKRRCPKRNGMLIGWRQWDTKRRSVDVWRRLLRPRVWKYGGRSSPRGLLFMGQPVRSHRRRHSRLPLLKPRAPLCRIRRRCRRQQIPARAMCRNLEIPAHGTLIGASWKTLLQLWYR
jgi:hypothetical protein